MKLLLVEDDPNLGDGLSAGLRQEGYALDWMRDGESARQALELCEYDAVVLDLGLPGCDGLELLRWYRRRKGLSPVLILTALDTVQDRVKGLDAGGDDYVLKPFDLDELGARLRALIRRSAGAAAAVARWGCLELDSATHQVKFRNRDVDLTSKEFALLQTLFARAGRVVPKTRLAESLYSWDQEIESNALEVHIHNLRRKLESSLIRTVRGVGYVLERLD